MGFAKGLYAGAGSFLAIIGVLVMFGGGLAEVLKSTGSADVMVKKIMSKFPVSKKGVIVGTMVCQIIMVMLLGSNMASGAMLATFAVSLAARNKVSTPALAIAFHTSAATGLILGPFTPPVVQMLTMTGWSYFQWLGYVALPYAIILFTVGVFMAFLAEKKYGEFGENICYPADEITDDSTKEPTKEARRGAAAFIITIIPLVIYGIMVKGGMVFALFLLPALAIVVGLASRYKSVKIMEAFMQGASRMIWIFMLFVLFDPLLNFITATGAFTALNEILTPYVARLGVTGFAFAGSALGVFGVQGAGPAQVVILEAMLKEMASSMSIGLPLYISVLWIGSQITSFAYPGGEMFAEMGFSRSKHLKSMIVNGLVVTAVMMVYITIRGILHI